jgi:alanyl-tRNA synthetase
MKHSLTNIRSEFLNYFETKGHSQIQSSSLVPHNDPTLMFTNAGMVQFKNVFSGAEILKDKQGSAIKRAASSQKCVRAGGKHNDLDNVGYTARHHTFFEMLGNFSFSDYFKEGAIEYAWEFLTKVIGLPKEKLYTTVYHTDDEAANLWKKIAGIGDDRIIRIKTSDNFWAMGDTGPCGPCSEIFYDHGDKVKGGLPGTADEDGDRYIEIWNLVFMQFEKLENGEQISLPKPCIDTGMGLERITAVMQGKHNNYEIDLFENLINSSKSISNNSNPEFESSHRVIADHLRSCSFLIADGVSPSNEGRGYVLRRIMRRAMRHCHILGAKDPMMFKLLPSLIREMGTAYPELIRAQALISETLKAEEERFKETLDRGLKLLDGEIKTMKKNALFDGNVAFKLYDTFGFPLDLTEDILRAKNIKVDTENFNKAMDGQKEKARAAWAGSGEAATDTIWFDLHKKFGATEFVGYETLESNGTIQAIVGGGAVKKSATAGEKVIILANQTPFYGESGGQAGDKGIIITEHNAEIEIEDTKKQLGELNLHIGVVKKGEVKEGANAKFSVNANRRKSIMRNHSATHLAHAALRKTLGEHVTQKGSLVDENYFRFDFSHNKPVSKEEILKIEAIVNSQILANIATQTRTSTPEEAIKAGAMALFGEKYGDEVRVLSMGENNYSVELCGGTHVKRTGDIGLFKIVKETSVASGVRRIEAVTGLEAIAYVNRLQNKIDNVLDGLKSSFDEVEVKVKTLQDERKDLEKQVSELKKKIALGGGNSSGGASAENEVEKIGDVNFIAKTLSGVEAKDLRGIVDEYKKQHQNAVILIISESEGKVAAVAGVSDSLTSKYNAVDIVKKASEILGGKGGGGRPDFAQAGGVDFSKASDAFAAAKGLIK